MDILCTNDLLKVWSKIFAHCFLVNCLCRTMMSTLDLHIAICESLVICGLPEDKIEAQDSLSLINRSGFESSAG